MTVCYHEAAHAVVMLALGYSFRYVTVNPRDPKHSGHVMARCPRRGEWLTPGAVSAAGIIAQDFEACCGLTTRGLLRRDLVRDDGRVDLKYLRDVSWCAWSAGREEPGLLVTPVDLAASPVDLAVVCWRLAVTTVATHWDTIDDVARVLCDSSRALSSREVREIMADTEPDHEAVDDLPAECAEAWFLEHSRLKWTPSARWFADVERYSSVHRTNPMQVPRISSSATVCITV
ncbi:MAG: hypothetical protein ACREX8_14955 [Gammaproteobacteria bacterium]